MSEQLLTPWAGYGDMIPSVIFACPTEDEAPAESMEEVNPSEDASPHNWLNRVLSL